MVRWGDMVMSYWNVTENGLKRIEELEMEIAVHQERIEKIKEWEKEYFDMIIKCREEISRIRKNGDI